MNCFGFRSRKLWHALGSSEKLWNTTHSTHTTQSTQHRAQSTKHTAHRTHKTRHTTPWVAFPLEYEIDMEITWIVLVIGLTLTQHTQYTAHSSQHTTHSTKHTAHRFPCVFLAFPSGFPKVSLWFLMVCLVWFPCVSFNVSKVF